MEKESEGSRGGKNKLSGYFFERYQKYQKRRIEKEEECLTRGENRKSERERIYQIQRERESPGTGRNLGMGIFQWGENAEKNSVRGRKRKKERIRERI